MKRKRLMLSVFKPFVAGLFAVTSVVAAAAPTEVLFNFDTEDYTADYPNDAIRDLANLLTEEGVVGQFYVVGYLAQRLRHFGRQDGGKRVRAY